MAGSVTSVTAGSRTPVGSGAQYKRVRNLSATSGQPSNAAAAARAAKGLGGMSSPAPSEDSGIGMMYRQIIAHDPTISKT